jgi:hypothetical protein
MATPPLAFSNRMRRLLPRNQVRMGSGGKDPGGFDDCLEHASGEADDQHLEYGISARMVNELGQDGHQRHDALRVGGADQEALPYRSRPRRRPRDIICGGGLVHGFGSGRAQRTDAQPEQVTGADDLDRHEDLGRCRDDHSEAGEDERQEYETAQGVPQHDPHGGSTTQGDGTAGLEQDGRSRDRRQHRRQGQETGDQAQVHRHRADDIREQCPVRNAVQDRARCASAGHFTVGLGRDTAAVALTSR